MTRQGRVFRWLLGALGHLSLPANRRVARVVGWLFRSLPNRTHRVTRRNVAACFPELVEQEQKALVDETMRQIGYGFLELPLFWRQRQEETFALIRTIHGGKPFQQAVAAGGGVLVIAPHLGAWELLCQWLSAQGPSTFLYREPKDPGIAEVVTASRERLGAEMVRAGGPGVRRLFKALQQGRIVGLMPDQQPKRGQGEFAPFFGHQALTVVLPSKFIQRTKSPVVLAYAERLPDARSFDLHIVPADPALRSADLSASVVAVNRQVESLVRTIPAQYQWGYKRFSMRPEGEPPFYD